ncbi:Nif3-like dinuclear metal center hexameric protein [Allorhodopirellula solitaria]|uniref:GTP cyclohydrolase 1 type 2 homolog n=1 Tax=Allorhodopirellula solitaria TaxID=2527987 RepID=A0A5C5YGW3_9BACT|nr:Nif3-like dinuclear metal center hexameric protein [Allorhodopirellula solitaria]TWT74388.1 putative GTP cyclohydrolase 1 type 2 [Allorhodopirellula solitaria]
MQVQHFCQAMAEQAPLRLAEDWDNVGLLLGDRSAPASRVMTCLTVTPDVVDEAEAEDVDLLIAHHPLPFQPLRKITTDAAAGKLVWRLCRNATALYSAHTAYDSAPGGINDQWCESLALSRLGVLIPAGEKLPASQLSAEDGAGRYGEISAARPAHEILTAAAVFSGATRTRMVGDCDRAVQRIGIACGSGGSFVGAAHRLGCDMLLTGEATFHTCLEAENTGLTLGMLGHYASERFAMESLAQRLQTLPSLVKIHAKSAQSDDFRVWASRRERDVIAVDPISPNP